MKNRLFPFVVLPILMTSLACQVASSPVTGLLATPTSTFTVTPSPTATLQPTFTPTLAPSPTLKPTGLSFEELPGNGTKVWDYDSGYILVLSGEWVLIPTDKDDLRNAIRDLSSLDQDMANSLRNMDLLNNDTIRLIFVSRNPEYRNRELLPNMISFSFQDPVIRNAPMYELVEFHTEYLKENFPSADVFDQGVRTNSNNVEYGYIDVETRINERIRPINVYQQFILVKADATMTFFNVTIPSALKDQAGPLLEDFINSIYLFDGLPEVNS
jgi:hypothetical protein